MNKFEQIQMFPDNPMPYPPPQYLRDLDRLQKMHLIYGTKKDQKCGDCTLLRIKDFHNKRYFKCALYGDTNGEGTDWRKKWEACGKFILK